MFGHKARNYAVNADLNHDAQYNGYIIIVIHFMHGQFYILSCTEDIDFSKC